VSTVVRCVRPEHVALVEEPDTEIGATGVAVRTLFSGISAGTELTAYRGSNPYLSKRWDPQLHLFLDGSSTVSYPFDRWGYEEVGVVEKVGRGVTKVAPGDLIWGAWGHRSTAVLDEPYAAGRILPAGADPIVGIFSEIGGIALNVVLDADIHVSETVAVFGLGVLGQLVAQLARLNGAEVIAVDMRPYRLRLAARLGARHTIDASAGGVAERVRDLTGGRGADVSLEVTGSYRALHEAIRATAYNSRVVAAGFFQGKGADLRLGEEFHHNRIQLVCSQIAGVAAGVSHRWNRYRLTSTAVRLAVTGALQVRPLITHILPVADAGDAFRMLANGSTQVLQVVLAFDDALTARAPSDAPEALTPAAAFSSSDGHRS
jgi:threonine dehydrogenase-like Zn-dependent dehydrogenase